MSASCHLADKPTASELVRSPFNMSADHTLTMVLAPAVGVMQQRIGPSSPPDRHHQRIGDELLIRDSPD
jgi:hypothetical protein